MRRRGGLLAGYRIIPLLIVCLFGVIAFVYSFGPSLLFGSLYPLEYEEQVSASSAAHGVDPYLVAAVIKTESDWDEDAASPRGAQGLMQLMPATAEDMIAKGRVDGTRYDAANLSDPETNIEFGCAYLAYLLDYFHGATDKAVAAYNAGMGSVDAWVQDDELPHHVIEFPETQAYVVRVNVALARYRDLYRDAFA
ncbi:MAG: lytic transglycosylase domain-containing protein [Coriobacteriaceae bacterium]|nr:lytic transglycosylase domain-containing protein [Coriobacteriaceae bacterium]